MNPEIKTKWVEALRSGTYTQERGRLKRNDGFCCLGVLCDMLDPAGWSNTSTHHRMAAGPCEAIMHQTDLTETNVTKLVELNDDRGLNFNYIADWIEDNL